jgi:hemolysin III
MSQGNWPFLGVPDPISAATHFAALLLATAGTLFLWRLCRGDHSRRRLLACFGLSMMTLYAASTIYHALPVRPEHRWVFRLLDQSAIYGLIAGTYTPAFALLIRAGRRRWLLLGGIWLFAVAGVVCKWSLPSEPFGLTIGLYLGMGWMALLPIVELTRAVGWRGILWAAGGGVCYTLAAVADLIDWPVFAPYVFGAHELSHLLDMAGTGCHFVFMVSFVVPFAPAPAEAEAPDAVDSLSPAQPAFGYESP